MAKPVDVVRALGRASELFRDNFAQIEKRVPECFRSNPGGKLTPARRRRLMAIIEEVERSNAEVDALKLP